MRLKWVSSFGKITPCSTTPKRTAACPDSTHGVWNRQRVLHGHAGRSRGANLVVPPPRLGAAERGWDGQRTTTYPTSQSPSYGTREALHGMRRRAASRPGETLAESSKARAGTHPEMGSASWGKAPSRDQNPAYVRWRIGSSTRGSDAPPRSAGKPRTGGSTGVGRPS
jgi:hypothetical protein